MEGGGVNADCPGSILSRIMVETCDGVLDVVDSSAVIASAGELVSMGKVVEAGDERHVDVLYPQYCYST